LTDAFRHVFVDTVPDAPAPGVVYVSLEYSTAVHLCACGCGLEVVTPLSPTDWQIAYDGETLSLIGGDEAVSGAGSIGNWSFPCGSHYLIRRGRVQWRRPWLPAAVAAGRAADRLAKQEQHDLMPIADGRRNGPRRAAWSSWLRLRRQARWRRGG
jgi:hypothetical protein